MNERDTANYKYLRKVLNECWGFQPSSLEWLNSVFDDPSKREIDPIYKNIIDENLRVRWSLADYLEGNPEGQDLGWSIFRIIFSHPRNDLAISYKEFSHNLKQVGKQKMKLNKVIADYYLENEYSGRKSFFYDMHGSFGNNEFKAKLMAKMPVRFNNSQKIVEILQNETYKDKITTEEYTEVVTGYILLANELIGKYKKPLEIGNYELVLSLNWADWLLCSTGESWSSCWSMESDNGYWTGIPFLFDDRNRGMFYVTNSKMIGNKKYRDFEVEHFITRSWTLLNKEDRILPVRWFPNSCTVPEKIEKVTPLKICDGERYFGESKYPFMEKIRFADGKGWIIPFLDKIGVVQTREGRFSYGVGGVTGGSANVASDMFYANSKRETHLFDLGISLYERKYAALCIHCKKKIMKGTPDCIQVGAGEHCCSDCHNKLYDKCEICGREELKETLRRVGKRYSKICNRCFDERFVTCSICGEPTDIDKTKNGICDICQETSDEVVVCNSCGEVHSKKNVKSDPNFKFITKENKEKLVFCGESCFNNFVETLKINDSQEWKKIRKCSCGRYFHDSLLTVDYKKQGVHKASKIEIHQEYLDKNIQIIAYNYGEAYICDDCSRYEADKKQFHFSFQDKESKIKKADSKVA